MSRIRANLITNQSADGSPTVQDGLVISGVTTSTTFSGSGASLTNLNASNIASGTVPTARLGSGTANSSTFLAGDSTFKTVTGTTINNNADNRIITGSGTANTLNGESGVTYDGTNFTVSSGVLKLTDESNGQQLRIGANGDFYIEHDGNNTYLKNTTGDTVIQNDATVKITASSGGTERFRFDSTGLSFDADTDSYISRPSADKISITTGGSERFSVANTRIDAKEPLYLETAGSYIKSNQLLFNPSGAAYIDHGVAGQSLNFRMSSSSALDTNAMTINHNGHVTQPSQPSFAAYKAANSYTQSGVIVFDATKHNTGNHYSTSNGRFTAPVAGKYQFTFWSIILGQYSSAYYSIRINGSAGRGMYVHVTQTHNGWDNTCTTWILNLNASDYVDLNSNSSINWHGNDWQLFSGQLLS